MHFVRFIGRHTARAIAFGVVATLVTWLLVWSKASVEQASLGWFPRWVVVTLIGPWMKDSGELVKAFAGLGHTLLLVVAATVLANVTGLWLGWQTSRVPHARVWSLLDSLINGAGGIPVFFLCFLYLDAHFEIRRALGDTVTGWILVAVAVVILAWAEGNGSLWVRLYRQRFTLLRSAPHILAARARGMPIGRRIWSNTMGVFTQSLGGRIAVLLSAAAIVEYMLEMSGGIGFAILQEFLRSEPLYSTLAAQTFALSILAGIVSGIDSVAREWAEHNPVIPV